MRQVRIQTLKTQVLLADQCLVAESFHDRLRGLMGRTQLRAGEGMLFPKCTSIHTWFMRMPIDVVFVDRSWRVTSLHGALAPWRPLPLWDFRAAHALELPAGTIGRAGLRKGDELCSS